MGIEHLEAISFQKPSIILIFAVVYILFWVYIYIYYILLFPNNNNLVARFLDNNKI